MYKSKVINLNNIFSFWNEFRDEEKFLFYSPYEKEIIMGAIRLKTFRENESLMDINIYFPLKHFLIM